MKILCLVTARSGSKRFPGKNLAVLGRDPLVYWSWRALDNFRFRMAKLGHEAILRLSTDSQDIANAWPKEDRPADLRPVILAQDDTTSMDVVRYEMRKHPSDMVILLQPTSPLLTVDDVEAAWAMAMKHDTSIAVAELRQPLAWLMQVWAVDGLTESMNISGTAVIPCGLYCAKSEILDRNLSFTDAHPFAVMIAPERAVDIDYPVDLAVAEWYLQRERDQLDMLHLC